MSCFLGTACGTQSILSQMCYHSCLATIPEDVKALLRKLSKSKGVGATIYTKALIHPEIRCVSRIVSQ